MNLAGVLMLRFIGSLEYSAEAQAAYAVGYNELFALITWTSVGLMGATAAVAGQNLGAGHPDRSARAARVAAMIGVGVAVVVGVMFLVMPRALLVIFGMDTGIQYEIARELLSYLAISGVFVTVALTFTGALQGTGDTRSPLYISIVSQVVVPIGLCFLPTAHERSRGTRHLAGDRPGAHDPRLAERATVPAGQVGGRSPSMSVPPAPRTS